MIRKLAFLTASLLLCSLATAQLQCSVEPFGRGCGPKLAGKVADNEHRVFDHVLALSTTGAPAHTIGLCVVGLEKAEWKLPFMACDLLVAPHGIVLVRSDKDGAAEIALPFRAADGLTAHVQQCFFEFGKGGVKAVNSNGLTLSCKARK